jgi:non-specific serine/threonine protein kinase
MNLPNEALTYGAVALFADRVTAVDARFTITRENVEPIVEICRRLDGIPLAIELAAARAAVLAPRQICARLDSVFDLLTGHSEMVLARHQTMRAVIDWSYQLLSEQARVLFDRLAIFAGGFTLEAATEVCAGESIPAGAILELLTSLIAQSLVTADFARGDARYHLLEAMRQYGLEKLEEHGERELLARRHALACLRVAENLDRSWYDAPEHAWFHEAESELDNCRHALAWSLAEGHDLQTGRLLAGALARVWYSLSPVEGRRWVRLAIEAIDDVTPLAAVAQLNIAEAELCGALGEYTASLASAERALEQSEALDELHAARAKQAAGSALAALKRGEEGELLLAEALAAAKRLGNRRLQALVLGDLGTARSRRGDVAGARRFYDDALACYVALGIERPAASIAGNLAEVEFAGGDAAAALARAEEARAGHEATQNRRSAANDLSNMTAYLIALDCFDDARAHATDGLIAARAVKATALTAYVLQHIAAIAALRPYANERHEIKARERAAMLLGFVNARLATLEAPRDYTEQQEHDRIVAALRNALGERHDELTALGGAWTEDGAVAVALEI